MSSKITYKEFENAKNEIRGYEPYLFDSCDLAEVILHLSDTHLSNLELQKMLFFISCLYKKDFDKNLLYDDFEIKGDMGAVWDKVYKKYRNYGGNAIDKPDVNFTFRHVEAYQPYFKYIIDTINNHTYWNQAGMMERILKGERVDMFGLGEYQLHSKIDSSGGEIKKLPHKKLKIPQTLTEPMDLAKPLEAIADLAKRRNRGYIGEPSDNHALKQEIMRLQNENDLLNDRIGMSESKDHINPNHYKAGKVECIEALESATINKSGLEAVCVANVIKYLWRYEAKGGLQDVKKAQWYLERLIKHLGESEEISKKKHEEMMGALKNLDYVKKHF